MIVGRRQYVAAPASAWRCPFCGSYDNYVARPGGNWTITCCVCHAHGPICDGAEDARARWEEAPE